MDNVLSIDNIRQLSAKQGVVAFFASTFQPDLSMNRLTRWLSMGYHASMQYLENRLNMAFPDDTMTILSFAFPYNARKEVSAQLEIGSAWISRYGWGKDYHRLISKRLRVISGILNKQGYWTRILVDTAPLLEKAHAEKAGLGFIGKNTCLIHPHFGSYLFLGFILTNWESSERGAPISISCGTCSKCIDACPTGALEEPGILDSRRCISYWTIEHKGSFPEDIFPFEGNLFGCDICQEVCPFNEKAPLSSIKDFYPKEGLYSPGVKWIYDMDYSEWDILTRGTAVRRAGFLGLKRNAYHLIKNG